MFSAVHIELGLPRRRSGLQVGLERGSQLGEMAASEVALKTAQKRITQQVEGLLESSGLKRTSLRVALLQLLVEAPRPLGQMDLIQALHKKLDNVDRVTVYRNLKQMVQKGLVHEVDVNQYIFCEHDCDQHAHLLLFCTSCGRHQEIRDHKKISQFGDALAEFAFFGAGHPISLRGICRKCQS